MNSQHVSCPHCQALVLNDGTLSGRLVKCPSCGGQMQLPGAAAVPTEAPPSPPPPPVQVFIRTGHRVRSRSQSHLPFDWSWTIAISLVCVVVVGSFLGLSTIGTVPMGQPPNHSVKDRPARTSQDVDNEKTARVTGLDITTLRQMHRQLNLAPEEVVQFNEYWREASQRGVRREEWVLMLKNLQAVRGHSEGLAAAPLLISSSDKGVDLNRIRLREEGFEGADDLRARLHELNRRRIREESLVDAPQGEKRTIGQKIEDVDRKAERVRAYRLKLEELQNRMISVTKQYEEDAERDLERMSKMRSRLNQLSPVDKEWRRLYQEHQDLGVYAVKRGNEVKAEMENIQGQVTALKREYADVINR